MDKPKVIVICGPTASGKTALSIELAKKIDGEIISCDSMQIYKDMNIGTAKVTKSEMQPVIIGAGPAGLFSALIFVENGIKPILIERGKRVEDRNSFSKQKNISQI